MIPNRSRLRLSPELTMPLVLALALALALALTLAGFLTLTLDSDADLTSKNRILFPFPHHHPYNRWIIRINNIFWPPCQELDRSIPGAAMFRAPRASFGSVQLSTLDRLTPFFAFLSSFYPPGDGGESFRFISLSHSLSFPYAYFLANKAYLTWYLLFRVGSCIDCLSVLVGTFS